MKSIASIFIRKAVLFLLLTASLGLPAASASPEKESLFHEANLAYQNGDYAAAVELYKNLLAQGQSANLLYNLGNTYYQLGDFGNAILHYEKALVLDPNNPDILANVRLARRAAEVPAPERTFLEQFAAHAKVNTWTWLVVLTFWIACFLIFLPRYYRWNIPLRRTLIFLCILGFAAGMAGMAGYHTLAKEGVVIAEKAPLKVAPTSTSPERTSLQAGTLAVIQQRHGDYYLVQIGDQQSGWIASDQFQPIW